MDAVMERETLAAFVDGALSPEESAEIVLHLADHPRDAAHVDALMELNALLGQAYAAPLHEPAPERILAAILGPVPARGWGRVEGRPEARVGWRRVLGRSGGRIGAAAAALTALAAMLFAAAILPGRFDRPVQIAGAPPAVDAELRAALETLPSGPVETVASHRLALMGTFLDKTGRPCREYELLDPAAEIRTQGFACRADDGEWSTVASVASRLEAATERQGFVPASGAESEPAALDQALDLLGAGMTLTPDEERTLIAGWRG